ncbi:MAG: NAD(P)H-hydrate dehydratase [Acidimicrobiales bacterium]
MIPVVTPTEMAAIDAAAHESVGVLIDRAGAAVALEAMRLLGGTYGRRVVVLAGKGNNGADGRSAAAVLRRRGARVQVVEALDAPTRLPDADLIIDAAYGTGFHGSYDAPVIGATPVLAVDVPSGVSGLTGQVAGRVLGATRTVTFAALKPGLLLEPGRSLAGSIALADIGLAVGRTPSGVVEASDVRDWLPPRRVDRHKWDSSLLVIAGSPAMTGAAHLVAAAAQRAGAGMVRVAIPEVADDVARPTESVGVELAPGQWADAAHRCRALVIGPGLGRSEQVTAEVRSVVSWVDLPMVIDADALVAIGSEVGVLARPGAAAAVLTPHDGEYERLMGSRPSVDRLDAARALATVSGSVVLLKGSVTVVAHPDGRVRVSTTGDARLATAGTGDVLSGVIGALLARGLSAFDAAAAGAWLHGHAAQLGSSEGLVASDLLTLLPCALQEVSG